MRHKETVGVMDVLIILLVLALWVSAYQSVLFIYVQCNGYKYILIKL